MSRIASNPVTIPSGAEVRIGDGEFTAKGPKGSLSLATHPLVGVAQEEDRLTFAALDESAEARAMAGTTRALVHNMVHGVTAGFERRLMITGVGYRAQMQGGKLSLTLGFSHPVVYEAPAGVTIETPAQNEIVVRGADKQKVGQTAAEIRRHRPPEPYKGKGVRYSDERVLRKQAKKK